MRTALQTIKALDSVPRVSSKDQPLTRNVLGGASDLAPYVESPSWMYVHGGLLSVSAAKDPGWLSTAAIIDKVVQSADKEQVRNPGSLIDKHAYRQTRAWYRQIPGVQVDPAFNVFLNLPDAMPLSLLFGDTKLGRKVMDHISLLSEIVGEACGIISDYDPEVEDLTMDEVVQILKDASRQYALIWRYYLK